MIDLINSEEQFLQEEQAPLRAQGTIEYLVILAVVVVLGLVVVALAVRWSDSSTQNFSSSSGKLSGVTSGGIGIIEAVTDSGGDSLVSLQNNSGEILTLSKIVVGGNETIFDEQLVMGTEKTFSLQDLNLSCPCSSGQQSVSCTFQFYLNTSNGLEKTQTTTISTTCAENTSPTEPSRIVGLGTGTLTNPWIINSCSELQRINEHLDGNYALGADINCFETRSWNSGLGFSPIGTFSGSLDGGRKTIYSLLINRYSSSNIGVFSTLNSGSSVSNITFSDLNVVGGTYTGAIASVNNGTIYGVGVSGSIVGNRPAGGLVGSNTGTVSSSYMSGSVVNPVDNSQRTGGLAGENLTNATIVNCYVSADVNGCDRYVGGITGGNWGNIWNSYASGSARIICANRGAGGLIGFAFEGVETVYNSFSVSAVSAPSYPAGLFGEAAGFSCLNSYFDETRTGQSACSGNNGNNSCTGVNTASADMDWAYYDTNQPMASWGTWANVSGTKYSTTDGNWSICRGSSYPWLTWENRSC